MMDAALKAVTAAVEAYLEKLVDDTDEFSARVQKVADSGVYTLYGSFFTPAIAEVAIIAALKAIRDPGLAIFERHTAAPRPVSFIHRHVIDDMLAQLGESPDLDTERTQAMDGK